MNWRMMSQSQVLASWRLISLIASGRRALALPTTIKAENWYWTTLQVQTEKEKPWGARHDCSSVSIFGNELWKAILDCRINGRIGFESNGRGQNLVVHTHGNLSKRMVNPGHRMGNQRSLLSLLHVRCSLFFITPLLKSFFFHAWNSHPPTAQTRAESLQDEREESRAREGGREGGREVDEDEGDSRDSALL
ncbi:hypothetical protein SAY87_024992 [Trapa incisa]|uniref:Secreted protein n=1 Tax=Trapa incisa TaxID=236973 RepID=A0AAN7GQ20_9MYRT|nr:hypothetical protein SAY87_024992 [Trapa incisa]